MYHIFIGVLTLLLLTFNETFNIKMSAENSQKSLLLDYFNISDGIRLSWAHAVNNKVYLDEVLANSHIMMLEADVLMDPLKNIPIMAHPPFTSSDIDLEHWINAVIQTNKGLKLDFKQDAAVTESYNIINRTLSTDNHQPIILNADILLGPNSDTDNEPVHPKLFIDLCKKFPKIIISPGWVTQFKPNGAGYSWENVKEMYNLVKDLKQDTTFPIRASLVTVSSEQLIWLLEQDVDKFSLTVWTSIFDTYNVKELLFLRTFKKQVYFDLPESEISELISLSS